MFSLTPGIRSAESRHHQQKRHLPARESPTQSMIPGVSASHICEQIAGLWHWLQPNRGAQSALHQFPDHWHIEFPLVAGFVSFKNMCLISALIERRGGECTIYIGRHDQASEASQATRYAGVRTATHHSLVITVNQATPSAPPSPRGEAMPPPELRTHSIATESKRCTGSPCSPMHPAPNLPTVASVIGIQKYCLLCTRMGVNEDVIQGEASLLHQRWSTCMQSTEIRHQVSVQFDTSILPPHHTNDRQRMLGFHGMISIDHCWLMTSAQAALYSDPHTRTDVPITMNTDRSGLVISANGSIGAKFYQTIVLTQNKNG